MKDYCKKCGIAINTGGMFGFGRNCFEFEDGNYCFKCAKAKVEKARSEED